VALRDSMRDSAAQYLRPGEPLQAVIGAQTASQWLAALTGVFVFLGPQPLPDPGRHAGSHRGARRGQGQHEEGPRRGAELPRSTRLGPATGVWHQIPAGNETLRVHRRFFKDIETADAAAVRV
jgi:hypothetical protein